jgi:hypothetical protein
LEALYRSESLHGHVGRTARAHGEADAFGLALGPCDVLLQCIGRMANRDGQYIGPGPGEPDRRQISSRVIGYGFVHKRAERGRAVEADAKGGAVGPGLVLVPKRLLPVVLELFAHAAKDDVERPASWPKRHDSNRLGRPFLRKRGAGG